ncbi:MAG: hypothetical protein HRT89_00355 [Lentisphaeria bacterium]|nr:hypothetical protein [Lentisphaeria bacterium]NQZ66494.1 hypothetical protein [Lentisphaeria bacterium]
MTLILLIVSITLSLILSLVGFIKDKQAKRLVGFVVVLFISMGLLATAVLDGIQSKTDKDALDNKIVDIQTKSNTKDTEISDLKEEAKSKDKKIKDKEDAERKLKLLINDLNAKNKELDEKSKTDSARAEEKIKGLETDIAAKTATEIKLKVQLEELSNSDSADKGKLTELVTKNQTLTTELDDLKQKCDAQKEELKVALEKSDQLNNELTKLKEMGTKGSADLADKMKNIEAEKSKLEDALKKSGALEVPHFNAGNLSLLNNEPKAAIKHFTRAIELKNGYIDALHFRAIAYGQTNDYKKALKDLNIVISNGTDKEQILNAKLQRAYTSCQLNDKSAIDQLTEIISEDKKNAYAYLYRGERQIKEKKYDAAIKDLEKACKYQDYFLEAKQLIVEAYKLKKDKKRSAKEAAELLKWHGKTKSGHNPFN